MSEPRRTADTLFEARVTDLIIRLSLLALFIYLSYALIRPLLPILIWALILAVALAPVHASIASALGNRRKIAAGLLCLLMLAVVIGPVAALTNSLVETAHVLTSVIENGALRLPAPPPRLSGIPLIGDSLQSAWMLASTNLEALILRYRDMLGPLGARLVGLVSQAGLDFLRVVLSVILAAVLLVPTKGLAEWGRLFAARIFAPRGEAFVQIAIQTIRNVSRGVVGTALLQSLLIGIVLQLAGVWGAGLLAIVILLLCLIQIGPGLVVLPVLIWAWLTMTFPQALVLTLVLIPLTLMDNVLKPLLMGRGLSTPTVVIFLGVIGGTLSFGLIGLFIGPVILAVFHDLLRSWLLHPPPKPSTEGERP